jgi:hypothetical protein
LLRLLDYFLTSTWSHFYNLFSHKRLPSVQWTPRIVWFRILDIVVSWYSGHLAIVVGKFGPLAATVPRSHCSWFFLHFIQGAAKKMVHFVWFNFCKGPLYENFLFENSVDFWQILEKITFIN